MSSELTQLRLGDREGPSAFGGTNDCWSIGDATLGGVACRGVAAVCTVASDGTDCTCLVLDREVAASSDGFDTM